MHTTTVIAYNSAARTPVTGFDNFELWKLYGDMTCTIVGSIDTANITWVQTGGTPVTFTTPINQTHVEFTTTDLTDKYFTVYTNKGTQIEEADECVFYHHPIDYIIENINSVGTNNVTGLIGEVNTSVIPGMYPVDPTLANFSIVPTPGELFESKATWTPNTELILSGIPPSYTRSTLEVSLETSPGVWGAPTIYQLTEKLIGITSMPKIIFKYNHYGSKGEIDLTESILENNGSTYGISNVIAGSINSSTAVSNINVTRHTKRLMTVDDNIHSLINESASANNIISAIHTLSLSSFDDSVTSHINAITSVSDITVTLHTFSAVGG